MINMNLLERFLTYVKIDTMSDDTTGLTPSTNKQFNLANILKDELLELKQYYEQASTYET